MTNFCFKIRPTAIQKVNEAISSLVTDEIRSILTDCCVYQFLDFPGFDQNVPLIQKMINVWSVEEEAFIINGRKMKITVDEVALIIGMPNRGKKVIDRQKSRLDSKRSYAFRDEMKEISSSSSAEDFSKLYLKFLISNVFFISSNHTISSEYLNYANDLQAFGLFNWPQAIHSYLIYQLSNYTCRRRMKPNIWFLEHSKVQEPKYPDSRPRLMRWSSSIKLKESDVDSIFSKLEASQLSEGFKNIINSEMHLLDEAFLALHESSTTPPPPESSFLQLLPHTESPKFEQPNPPPQNADSSFEHIILSRFEELETYVKDVCQSLQNQIADLCTRVGNLEEICMERNKPVDVAEDANEASGECSDKDAVRNIMEFSQSKDVPEAAEFNVDYKIGEEQQTDSEIYDGLIKLKFSNDFTAKVDEEVQNAEAVIDDAILQSENATEDISSVLRQLNQEGLTMQNDEKNLEEERPKKKSRTESSIIFSVKSRDDRKLLLVKTPFTIDAKRKNIEKKGRGGRGGKGGRGAKKLLEVVQTTESSPLVVDNHPDRTMIPADGKLYFYGRDEIEKPTLEFLDMCFDRYADKGDVVFSDGKFIDITRGYLDDLMNEKDLSDIHIDAFVMLLSEKVQLNSASYHPFIYVTSFCHHYHEMKDNAQCFVKNITKDMVENSKYLFVPINCYNTHWILAVGVLTEKKWVIYDSLSNPKHLKEVDPVLKTLHYYLSKFFNSDIKKWPVNWNKDIPKQANSHDCGMYVCKFMETLVDKDKTLSKATQHIKFEEDMHIYRVKLAFNIYRKAVEKNKA